MITVQVFVYGSLKKGFFNHYRIKDSKKIHNSTVTGFKMFNLGFYPAIIRSDSGSIKGEVYDMPIKTFAKIASMELGAGYDIVTVKDSKGLEVVIFAVTDEEDKISTEVFKTNPLVEDGNWTLTLQNAIG